MDWSRIAREVIAKVAASIPDDATMKDRKAAINAAYPFGEREYWPYKAWLKARRAYLDKFDPAKAPAPAAPLFDGWARDPLTGRPIIPAPQPQHRSTS